MNPEELVEGEYYWIREWGDTEILVGKYDPKWGFRPHFDVCGSDEMFYLDDYEVISHIEKPQ